LHQDTRKLDGVLMLDFGGETASINMYKEITDESIAAPLPLLIDGITVHVPIGNRCHLAWLEWST
jgi:hypothetical protein